MVIFHSYVSLPEGRLEKQPGKTGNIPTGPKSDVSDRWKNQSWSLLGHFDFCLSMCYSIISVAAGTNSGGITKLQGSEMDLQESHHRHATASVKPSGMPQHQLCRESWILQTPDPRWGLSVIVRHGVGLNNLAQRLVENSPNFVGSVSSLRLIDNIQ